MDVALLSQAVIYDIVGMVYEGFPIAVIRKLWLSQVTLDVDCDLALTILKVQINRPTLKPYLPNLAQVLKKKN